MIFSKKRNYFLIFAISLMIFVNIVLINFMPFMAKDVKAQSSVNHTLQAKTVTIVNDTTDLSVPVGPGTEETYQPKDRQWLGVASIITSGDNIFAAWQTGGEKEPSPYNYIVIAASTDGGETWLDPFMIIDPKVEVMITVPMFYYNDHGQLFLLFYWRNVGVHALPLYNTDGALEDITYDEPFWIGTTNSSFNKPTVLKNGKLAYVSGGPDALYFESNDNGMSFNRVSSMESISPIATRMYAESSLVELEDGRLWAIRRLENAANGGMEQYFSYDGGLNWTMGEANLPKPLFSPGSRFNLERLDSGALLLVTNAEGMGPTNRRKMTAYLSYDDGQTWPYSLLLDNVVTSYPDFHQADDGNIHIIFDKDRYGEGSIRICVLTEEDIKAGEFISKDAKQLITVTKIRDSYTDIVSINEAWESKIVVNVGTEISSVMDKLSTKITATDNKGNNYTLNGTYRIASYDKDKEGTYIATFITDLPKNEIVILQDSFNLLSFKVIVKADSAASTNPLIFISAGIVICILLTFLIIKKKKNKI